MDEAEFIVKRMRDEIGDIKAIVQRIEHKQKEESAKVQAMSEILVAFVDGVQNLRTRATSLSKSFAADLMREAASGLVGAFKKRR